MSCNKEFPKGLLTDFNDTMLYSKSRNTQGKTFLRSNIV